MADRGDDWISPAGGPARDPDPPRFGERVPGWSTPTPPPAQVPPPISYVPPPRPGLIPLHPLSFGQLLGAAFAMIRYNPRASVAPAIIVSLLQNVLVLALTYGIALSAVDRVTRAATDADRDAIIAGTVGIGVVSALAVLIVSVIGSALLQGMLTRVVADGALGRRSTAGEALRAAGRRFRPLVGFALLLGVVQFVLILVFAGIVVGVIAAAGGFDSQAGIVIAVLLAIPVAIVLVVAYGFVAVKLAMAPSAILLEKKGVLAAIRRSWRLTRGAFWRTLGILALVTIMVSFAGQVVSLPFSIIGGALGGLLFPNAGSGVADQLPSLILSSLPSLVVAVIVTGIGQIAQVSAIVLVYVDRRMRLEGLDVELQRYVEQGGDDPFERTG